MALQRQLLKRVVDRASSSSRIHSPAITIPRSDYSTSSPPHLPPFDYHPQPYNGPSADEVFQKRKKFLGPSLFHFYQKPVTFSRDFDCTKSNSCIEMINNFCILMDLINTGLTFCGYLKTP